MDHFIWNNAFGKKGTSGRRRGGKRRGGKEIGSLDMIEMICPTVHSALLTFLQFAAIK
jgi:hypothetical protein